MASWACCREQRQELGEFSLVTDGVENSGLVGVDAVGGALSEDAAAGREVQQDAAAVVGIVPTVDQVVGDHAVDELVGALSTRVE
ncbi:hypothetical protein [Streptomyces sp. NPDC006334]|uniref:hypothetical protein n=1 Tax=Streptomyces sp. NPDC006334 TaxID=3156754 RepID=UPI0033ABBF37